MRLRFYTLSMVLYVCGWTLFSSFPGYGQLIEPTRTLNQDGKSQGVLTVLSEPPGLKVMLGSKDIGETPVFNAKVDAGAHILKVKDKQIPLQIAPGKTMRIALFKGFFIELPEQKEPEASQKYQAEETPPPVKSGAFPPKAAIQTNDPFYWPLNPRGPIY